MGHANGIKTQKISRGKKKKPSPSSRPRKKASLSYLQSVIDNLPVALFAKDVTDDFRFILWNKKQESITTLPREKALGKRDHEIFSAESADYFREVDEAVVKRGKIAEIPEEIIDTEEGGEVYLRTVKVPIQDSETGHSLLIGISEDITDRVKAREQLERLNQNLSEKNRELESTQLQLIQAEKLESIGRLAAGVAHEVKNPLALLLMGVEYISSGIDPDDPNLEVILSEMNEAIERADQIVRGLVDFSSDRQLTREETDLQPLIEHVLLMTRHELTRGSVKVSAKFQKDLPKPLLDSRKFEQVLINLILNAIHAMAESDNASELSIKVTSKTLDKVELNEGARTARRFRKGDTVIYIDVKDTGTGISKKNLEKIFDPFFTTKATGHGTGLGLSVVRKIVELHDGEISIRNRLITEGAHARITLVAPRRDG
ncbi:MAG: PAS domain-containing protein [Verrucomicrobiales bacterium]|nr:PAS domain-containing protein [Verrucomicrobiales bacterium]